MILTLMYVYAIVKFIDWIITEHFVLKIKYLEQLYANELETEPKLNPFCYIKGFNIYRYYYSLNINPIWHLIGNGYITVSFYNKLKANIKEYINDDY